MAEGAVRSAACGARRLLAALAILVLTGGSSAAQAPTDVQSFIRDVDTLIAATRAAAAGDAAVLRQRVPSRWSVIAGEQRFDVPTAWIVDLLDRSARDPGAWPASRAEIVSGLERLRDEAATLDAPPAHDIGASRAALTRVLAQPEFQRSAATVLIEALRTRVARALADLWQRLGGSRLGGARTARLLAWIVGLTALAALSWWLVRSLARSSGRRSLGLAPPPSRRRSSRAWAGMAFEAHRSGNVREAARCAYRAALARLEEEGAWRQDDARTPREYLRLLPAVHGRRAILADVTARFERAWYGAAAGTADDADALLARLKDLGCAAPDRAI